jgi:hypothetical protein
LKTAVSILALVLLLPIIAQTQDTLKQNYRTHYVNPYKNLKASVMVQSGKSPVLGRTTAVGFELRRFLSLEKYLFAGFTYGRWTLNKDRIENDLYGKCSYYLNSQTVTARFGLGIFGTYNFVAGTHFLFDAHLREKVPSSLDPEITSVVSGNISRFTRDFIPFFGYNMKGKLWKRLFLEIGSELWIYQTKIFQPLEGNWKVPDNVSPLLSDDDKNDPYYYVTLHCKL